MLNNLLLFIILIIIFLSNYLVLNLGDNHYNINGHCQLFDLFHKILPDLHNYHFLIDIILFCGIGSLFILGNDLLITEFLVKLIIIMFIRAFTTLVTILPKNEQCNHKMNIREYILGGCYDKIFSGHTSFILLLTLLYYREHFIGLLPLIFINLFNIFIILATRSHYTIDVLLAAFVTTTIYYIKI